MDNDISIKLEEVERFRDYLITAKNLLDEKNDHIHRVFIELHDVWQDVKYDKFKEAFDHFAGFQMVKFSEELTSSVNHLNRKIDIIREYLNS
jgi:hypothetical protein